MEFLGKYVIKLYFKATFLRVLNKKEWTSELELNKYLRWQSYSRFSCFSQLPKQCHNQHLFASLPLACYICSYLGLYLKGFYYCGNFNSVNYNTFRSVHCLSIHILWELKTFTNSKSVIASDNTVSKVCIVSKLLSLNTLEFLNNRLTFFDFGVSLTAVIIS